MKTKLLIATMFFGITTLFAQNIPSYVPTNGLVGWWPFNGNANDESGNGNNGVVSGATLTTDRSGKSNSAYSFDGLDDFIQVSNSSSLNITGNQITLSFWLYNMRNDKNQKGISKGGWEVGSGYEFLYVEDYGLQLSGKNGGLQRTESVNGAKFLNNWVHLVAVFNNGIGNFYINNVKISANLNGAKFTNFNATDLPLIFGKRSDQNKYLIGFVLGKMDDIAIYNRALSDQEVTLLFNGCTKETATLNATNEVLLKNTAPITLSALPNGGVFLGNTIQNGKFTPYKANLGSNTIEYQFTNSKGCKDTTLFKVMVYDTLGNVCSTTDTLKINVKLTTGIKANQITSINVYPNPTSDILIIAANDLDALNGYAYKIVDALGKLVYSKSIQNAITQIPLSSLGAKGTYLLQIIDASGTMIEGKHIVLQ